MGSSCVYSCLQLSTPAARRPQQVCKRPLTAFKFTGISVVEAMSETSEESYNKVFDINTKGVLFGINTCAAAMKKAGTRGSILVNSSILGHEAHARMPQISVYAASKAAAEMFVRYAAMEHAEAGALHSRPCSAARRAPALRCGAYAHAMPPVCPACT
jgi:NAD(P)-dependent dehydrogenase (short-subunit alcohol dehydrogenase family)